MLVFNQDVQVLSVKFRKPGDHQQLTKQELALVTVDADKKELTGGKRLFDCTEYQAIVKFDKACQSALAKRTLSAEKILRAGMYLIAESAVDSVNQQLKDWRVERARLIIDFLTVYESAKVKARESLRALYNANDYPSEAEVAQRFSMEWYYIQIAVPPSQNGNTDLLRQLGEETIQECRAALRESLYQLVARAADRLRVQPDGSKNVFRDTLVSNMAEFLEFFDSRNIIAQDAELVEVVEKAKAIFNEIPDAQCLRDNLALRERVQVSMASIQTSMEQGLVKVGNARRVEAD